jgi:DNA-directed RNA polymerase specialized sigma24 family protein
MTDISPLAQGEFLWTEHESYINKTAADISRSFWKVERDDLLQEIWVFLWEKEEHFLEQNRPEAYVKKCIYHAALNYAQKQRNATMLETETFYYSVDEVKNLMPYFLDSYEDWNKAPVPPGAETMTRNDGVEIMCDFSRVWERLTEGQQDILLRRYRDGEEFPEATDRKTLSRAITKFMDLLNRNTDVKAKAFEGPGAYMVNPAVREMRKRDKKQDRETGLSPESGGDRR